jgi:hypothetical protein
VDPQAVNIEVSGRHLGLIVNRGVYRALARQLSAAAGESQPTSSSPSDS